MSEGAGTREPSQAFVGVLEGGGIMEKMKEKRRRKENRERKTQKRKEREKYIYLAKNYSRV